VGLSFHRSYPATDLPVTVDSALRASVALSMTVVSHLAVGSGLTDFEHFRYRAVTNSEGF